ncbi:MAG TPA: hypothetical protein DDY14_03555 [Chromatiaceae bacterium]|nr:hypothetical protein [Chromatiaceae bacterium]
MPNRVIARNHFHRRLAPGLRVLPDRWRGEAVDCPRGCTDSLPIASRASVIPRPDRYCPLTGGVLPQGA